MATQECKSRRKPVTYGKKATNRALPMYNFLDPDIDTGPNGSSKQPERPLTNPQCGPLRKRSHDALATKTISNDASPAERSPTFSQSSTQDTSDNIRNGSTTSSVFDLVSSDEDVGGMVEARVTRKRRKLTPVRQRTKHVPDTGRKTMAALELRNSHVQESATAQCIEDVSVSSGSEHSRANSRTLPQPAATLKAQKKIPKPREGSPSQIRMDLIDSEEEVQVVSLTSSPTPPYTPVKKSPGIQRSKSSSPSAQLIDQLNRSIPFESRLTKHSKRVAGQIHDRHGVPSPSQLAMRSLRLTPEEAIPVEMEVEGQGVSLEARPLTPSRSRRRLIDALDSPRKRPPIQEIHLESPGSSPASSSYNRNDVGDSSSQVLQTNRKQVETKDGPPPHPIPALPVAGPKVTYAKQRSHLSDMLPDDLSDFALPSIACLVEPVAGAKASANASIGSQRSQEELRDEDDATGGAIRSIHELRQAGEISRFRGNLDSIFEDMEARGRTGRSRRLRGLLILLREILEPSFCQRFVEIGMHQRLANNVLGDTDVLSLMLSSCALSLLLCSCKPSLQMLQKVFDAMIHSSVPLLEETRDLSTFVKAMAKDRKQNLSGAICKDVIDSQHIVLASQMWTTNKPADLTPQLVALRSLEIGLRGIREMKDLTTSLPLRVFNRLVAILEGMSQDVNIDLSTPESVLTLESATAVLEFSAFSHGPLEDGYNEAANKLSVLGPLLSKAKVLPQERHDRIEQLVLRLVISVTNNNHVLCESLGQTPLITAISAIVKKNFLELADYADRGKVLDEAKLESVILALGSLINFAECSHSSRRSMSTIDDSGKSTVEWLVASFTKRVGKASEASSLEQTHALVAFGYLSMLICTLCLDEEIRNNVRGSMSRRSLRPLILAVEEFLNHFRTVEQVMVEDASNNFTDRFQGILNGLREAEV